MSRHGARSRALPHLLLAGGLLLAPSLLRAEPVAVRHTEGVVHGFLVLHTLDGKMLADGDLVQTARGDRVTSRLTFHFRDGSFHEETTVFTQRRRFHLLSDHLMQKGPAFPQAVDVTIDAGSGEATVRTRGKDGKEDVETKRFELPPDVANGLLLTLVKNFPPEAQRLTLSLVAAASKPRLVKLEVTRAGEDAFSVGGSQRRARHYVVKVDLGGITGVIAPLVGKQPPDSHVWILGGEAPAFVRSEAPLYTGGPLWRIDPASPVWR